MTDPKPKVRDPKRNENCDTCVKEAKRKNGGWDEIDLLIWHKNGHVWPGYAGEPDGGNYGGSDF